MARDEAVRGAEPGDPAVGGGRTDRSGRLAAEREPFREAGVTRLVVPYVPVSEPVIDDARRFVEAWGNS